MATKRKRCWVFVYSVFLCSVVSCSSEGSETVSRTNIGRRGHAINSKITRISVANSPLVANGRLQPSPLTTFLESRANSKNISTTVSENFSTSSSFEDTSIFSTTEEVPEVKSLNRRSPQDYLRYGFLQIAKPGIDETQRDRRTIVTGSPVNAQTGRHTAETDSRKRTDERRTKDRYGDPETRPEKSSPEQYLQQTSATLSESSFSKAHPVLIPEDLRHVDKGNSRVPLTSAGFEEKQPSKTPPPPSQIGIVLTKDKAGQTYVMKVSSVSTTTEGRIHPWVHSLRRDEVTERISREELTTTLRDRYDSRDDTERRTATVIKPDESRIRQYNPETTQSQVGRGSNYPNERTSQSGHPRTDVYRDSGQRFPLGGFNVTERIPQRNDRADEGNHERRVLPSPMLPDYALREVDLYSRKPEESRRTPPPELEMFIQQADRKDLASLDIDPVTNRRRIQHGDWVIEVADLKSQKTAPNGQMVQPSSFSTSDLENQESNVKETLVAFPKMNSEIWESTKRSILGANDESSARFSRNAAAPRSALISPPFDIERIDSRLAEYQRNDDYSDNMPADIDRELKYLPKILKHEGQTRTEKLHFFVSEYGPQETVSRHDIDSHRYNIDFHRYDIDPLSYNERDVTTTRRSHFSVLTRPQTSSRTTSRPTWYTNPGTSYDSSKTDVTRLSSPSAPTTTAQPSPQFGNFAGTFDCRPNPSICIKGYICDNQTGKCFTAVEE